MNMERVWPIYFLKLSQIRTRLFPLYCTAKTELLNVYSFFEVPFSFLKIIMQVVINRRVRVRSWFSSLSRWNLPCRGSFQESFDRGFDS